MRWRLKCGALVPTVGSLLHLSVVAANRGDAQRGEELLAQAAVLAQESTDGRLVLWVANHQADHLLRSGNLSAAASEGMAALRRIRVLGHGDASDASILGFTIAEALVGIGRIPEALAVIEEFTRRVPSRDDWFAQLMRAEVEAATGHLDPAWSRIAQVRAIAEGAPSERTRLEIVELEQRVTEIALWRRRPDDVADVVERLASVVPLLDGEASRQGGRLFSGAMRAQADRAELARNRRQPDAVATILEGGERLATLLASLPDDPHHSHPEVVTADAEHATWRAEIARLRGEDSPEHWARGAKAWAAIGRPHRTAYCLWRQAETLLASGRSPEAPDVLRRAADAAAEMAPLLALITDLAGRARIPLRDGAGPAPENARPYGLTPRELDVLALLVRGNTSREIATTLFISEKTVSVHVSNILRKLKVTSRVQAAMRAEREHLVHDPIAP